MTKRASSNIHGIRTGALAVLCVLAAAGPGATRARAAVTKYALLIGANQGHAHEQTLQFAENDVDRVADALGDLGGFGSEHIVRLKNADADRVREALVDLNLTIQAEVRSGNEAVLFVYYSGHGSAGKLHLGGSTLKTDELSKLVRLSPARLKLLFLDACRAGTLTRVKGAIKGGRQVAPFQIKLADELAHEGYAIITSSAAGEDAQESDALSSSIFTHHFLSGLRGMADANRDQLVTLGEAYAYAYAQSLETSMSTVAGSQHATFEYDLRGRADPVLADLRGQQDQAQLILHEPGDYLVMPDGTQGSLIEAHVERAGGTALTIPAAPYRVRLRTPRKILEARVALDRGQREHLHAERMTPLPLAQVVRKGEVAGLATGPSVGASLHGPIGAGFSPSAGLQLGWAFELPVVTLMPRLTLGRSTPRTLSDGVRAHDLTEIALELAGLYVVDVGPVSLAPMLSVGAASLHQQIDLAPGSCAPSSCRFTSRPLALVTSIGGWFGWAIGRGFSLEASVELATFYLGRQSDTLGIDTENQIKSGTVTYRAGLGLGYRY